MAVLSVCETSLSITLFPRASRAATLHKQAGHTGPAFQPAADHEPPNSGINPAATQARAFPTRFYLGAGRPRALRECHSDAGLRAAPPAPCPPQGHPGPCAPPPGGGAGPQPPPAAPPCPPQGYRDPPGAARRGSRSPPLLYFPFSSRPVPSAPGPHTQRNPMAGS